MTKHLKTLIWYYRQVWCIDRGYYISFGLLTAASIAAPIVSVLLPKIVIRDIQKGDVRIFTADLGLLAVAAIGAAFISAYYGFKNEDVFMGLTFKLKEPIQQRAMTMPFADTENPDKLNQLQFVSESVSKYVPVVHNAGVGLMSGGVILLFYLGLILYLQPALLIFPVLNIAAGIWGEDRAKKFEFDQRNENAALSRKKNYVFSLMYDYGYGKEIRLFDMKQWVMGIYRRYQREQELLLGRIARKKVLAAGIDLLFTLVREGSVYVYLIVIYLQGRLSIDSFVLYTGVFASFAAVGQNFILAAVQLADAARNIREYCGFVEEKTGSDTAGSDMGALPADAGGAWSVEFDRVSFRYPGSDRYVLKDFSCWIPAGAHVALVGVNGAGKSTVVKLLCGFYEDYAGTIRINGKDLREIEPGRYQEGIAAVFQNSQVLPATVLENITLRENNTPEETSRAKEALRLMGLWEKVEALSGKLDAPMTRAIHDDGVELSGGEKQKLAICRALYKGGSILLLDEPTAALDALAEHQIYSHFSMVSKGKTTLFISHRLNSTRFCDEIILLEDGVIAERGTHEELSRLKGKYDRLFQTQAKYYQEGAEEYEAER